MGGQRQQRQWDRAIQERQSRLEQLKQLEQQMPEGGLQAYLRRARSLLKKSQEGMNHWEGVRAEVPEGQILTGASCPGSITFGEFERLGQTEMPSTCFCLVAGSRGDKIGFRGVKIAITAEVTAVTCTKALQNEY